VSAGSSMLLDTHVMNDDDAFASEGGRWLADKVRGALKNQGECILGLCGGRSVGGAYARLAAATNIDWSKVTLFLTDERHVPRGDPRGNATLVRETLAVPAGITEDRLVFPDTSLPLDECTADYDVRLGALLLPRGPDAIALGMGEDGHIASLFPPLKPEWIDGERFAAHARTDRFEAADRITATLFALRRADHAAFFLTGEAKKRTWEEMMASQEGAERWPGKLILERCNCTLIAKW
jgi:6-phosphogluconolactonase